MKNTTTIEQQVEDRNGDGRIKVAGDDVSVPCYQSLVEHWAKARVDGPVEAVARYDDSAKQLITIGGFLQAGLVAVYAAISGRPGFSMTPGQKVGVVLFEVTLLFFISAAAWVCSIQPELKVESVSKLLDDLINSPDRNKVVTDAMCKWCDQFRKIVKEKQHWMAAAKISFVACCLTIALLLLLQFSA